MAVNHRSGAESQTQVLCKSNLYLNHEAIIPTHGLKLLKQQCAQKSGEQGWGKETGHINNMVICILTFQVHGIISNAMADKGPEK